MKKSFLGNSLTIKDKERMKKNLFMIAAVAIAAVACNKELPQEQVTAGETVTFEASVDGAETKVALDGKVSKWEKGDKITIHNGTKGYEFSTTDEGVKATFSYTGDDFSGDKFMAVYPAGTYTADVANKTVRANIPTYQQAQVGTYHNTAALAVAYSESNSFAFKNATALLKFKVNTDNVTHVVFHGNNNEAITGDVTVTLGDVVDVKCEKTKFTVGEVTEEKYGTWVECYAWHDEQHKYFVKGETYYIALAPQVFSKGVTVKFRIDEGEEIEVNKTENKVETKASTILNMGTLEISQDAETPDQPSVWSISGTHNNWGDTPMVTTTVKNVFVAKNITLEAYPSFKIRKDKAWTENYGGGIVYFNPNNWMKVYSGGSDISVTAAGTYDIYFDYTTKRLYVVTAGADYTKVPEQTKEGEEPKQEEPEVTEKTLYLKPNANWKKDNARFAAYFFGGTTGEKWVSMTAVGDGTYEAHLPEGYDYGCNVIFCRMNPSSTANNWNNKWNQTSDLKAPTDGKNLYTVKENTWDKGGGTWSVK